MDGISGSRRSPNNSMEIKRYLQLVHLLLLFPGKSKQITVSREWLRGRNNGNYKYIESLNVTNRGFSGRKYGDENHVMEIRIDKKEIPEVGDEEE